MKRRKPLQRGTSQLARTGMARGDKPLARSVLPAGRPPIKAKRRPVTNAESTARAVVRLRSGGTCEAVCSAPATDWHHRRNRSQAGEWSAPNGLHLCRDHHRWVTDHPLEGREIGWAVRSHENPAGVPCLRRGEWVWLLPGGGVDPLSVAQLVEFGGAA